MTTGATSLIQTAVNAGVRVCFANAGTTEMPIAVALDCVPGMRVVLGLADYPRRLPVVSRTRSIVHNPNTSRTEFGRDVGIIL